MRLHQALHRYDRSMKRKLFVSMLALAAVLLAVVLASLFFLGRFSSEQRELTDALDLQLDFFEKEVALHSEEAAALGVELSREMTAILEDCLLRESLTFDRLTNNADALRTIQQEAILPLRQKLFQTDCSGAFFLLDTTVNTAADPEGLSRSGLYLQKCSASPTESQALLYRGKSDVGKAAGIMPHRKWRLEFRTDLFADYDRCLSLGRLPMEEAYSLTEIFTLPGTSEEVMLMVLPLVGREGRVYGLCGFEISQSAFKISHAQPTKMPHLTCLVASGEQLEKKLSCGTSEGYFFSPAGPLDRQSGRGGLTRFTGGSAGFVGLTRQAELSPNNGPFTLAAMIPRADYTRAAARNVLQLLLLTVLLAFFTVTCCIFFSRRFLTPVLRSLEQMKTPAPRPSFPSGLQEIDDLFGFLAEKDRRHEDAIRALEDEKEDAQAQAARLAYDRSQETDPQDYRVFLDGISRLTPAEKDIFGYYLEGKTVKDILEIANIKESTLRYHNRNIYSKLGVNSLRQLLRFAALMQSQENPD